MLYRASFNGRRVDAGGVTMPQLTYAYGDDEESARLSLYERFEHIMFLRLEPWPIISIRELKVGDRFYKIEDGKLIGATDPTNSSWEVVEGDAFPGFRCCMNHATGQTSQQNDGNKCVIQ